MRYALLLLVLPVAACIRPKPLPVLGEVPQFQLVAQDGRPFDSKALDGHVWVADFIYTHCDGPCPMMSSQMRQVQASTAETPDVLLVSITVDPKRDSPEVLAEYARHFKPDWNRWHFLTGPQEDLNRLGVDGFKLNSVDGNLSHSTRFVLVDSRRRIRGYYVTSEDAFLPKLIHDIRQLKKEKS